MYKKTHLSQEPIKLLRTGQERAGQELCKPWRESLISEGEYGVHVKQPLTELPVHFLQRIPVRAQPRWGIPSVVFQIENGRRHGNADNNDLTGGFVEVDS